MMIQVLRSLLYLSPFVLLGESIECPSWYFPVNNSSPATTCGQLCKCGSDLHGVVKCEQNSTVRLSVLHCMTSDTDMGTIEGYCPYGRIADSINTAFVLQPHNASHLTEFTCNWLNRTGQLCSNCEDSLGVAVLSYSFGCVVCLGKLEGWFLYLSLTLFPLTLFFFIVILCNIDATAAHMNSVLCIMQILIFSLNTNPQSFLETGTAGSKRVAIVAWTIVGFWNLDILRYVYPPFCITTEMSILQVMSLEYIVALFPLVLIAIAYALIELHDNDYRVVKLPWLVVKRWLKRLRKCHRMNFAPKSSIISHFSTFLLLAYSKILFVSLNLITVTYIYKMDGNLLDGSSRVYYNASVPYLGSHHLPYFILAFVTTLVFNIVPLLVLFLYPVRNFQKLLSKCSCIRWHPLHAFADKFQGCYKDGTNKSLDYRYFAGIFLLIRILYHLHVVLNNRYSMYITQVIPMVSGALFGILRPYKNDFYNRLDCSLFAILTLGQISLATNKYIANLPISLLYILAAIPLSYLLLLLLYKILALCAPELTARVRQAVRVKLLRRNLLFLSQSELEFTNTELEDNDGLVWGDVLRGLVQSNPVRHSLPLRSNKKGSKSHVTTYSTLHIDP
jgi:hypothetical protein